MASGELTKNGVLAAASDILGHRALDCDLVASGEFEHCGDSSGFISPVFSEFRF